MKLRILIAEDEPVSRERLRQLLEQETTVEVVAECRTGTEALHAIRQTRPDIVFLDVRMPELDGFGVIEKLNGSFMPVIIFVTAHDKFALRAFDVHAADYLLKPFDRERFQIALQRARERLQGKSNGHHSPVPTTSAAPQTRQDSPARLTIKSQGRIAIVSTHEIDWACSADNYVELHVGGTTHLLRSTITALANQLPPGRFVRISRSHLVNVDQIREIRSKSHGDYVIRLHCGIRLNGSRTYRPNLAGFIGL